jgi:hypothetical protein
MLKPRTKEGQYIQKYFYLRGKGFTHIQASETARKEVDEDLDFDEKNFLKRIKKYRLAYGCCMYVSCIYMAYALSTFAILYFSIFFIVAFYTYKTLMKLRRWDETWGID